MFLLCFVIKTFVLHTWLYGIRTLLRNVKCICTRLSSLSISKTCSYKFCIYRQLWKEWLNSDGQQFYQYQQNKQSPLSLTHWTQKGEQLHMTLKNPVFGFMATEKFSWKSRVVKVDFTLSVVQSEVQGHLVILISLLLYICHVSFQKMLISCLLKYIVLIKYFESDFLEKFSLSV
jgi:hypothetical protein